MNLTGPVLTGPVPGQPGLLSTLFDLAGAGYVAQEYFLSGEAASYEASGPAGDDGRWQARPGVSAPFTTRMVVYRPADPARFNGAVVAEWLNVTAGADTPAEWLNSHRHLLRAGFAWVGVSAQRAGIEGGGVFASAAARGESTFTLPPLKQSDPGRYGGLSHPGDAFCYDIFSQAGAVIRRPAGAGVLGPLTARRVLAAGQSQSAAFLVTYVNAVAPLAGGYDGYLIHGRPGRPAGLTEWDVSAPAGPGLPPLAGRVRVRTDGPAPVLILQTETDVFGALAALGARQPDHDRLRLWEVAGAAHADTYTVSAAFTDSGQLPAAELAALLAPGNDLFGVPFAAPVNSGPQQHYVAQAAIAALDRWVRDGTPPPTAARLGTGPGGGPHLDELGIVTGGVRSPWVDVPVAVLSGLGQESSPGPAFLFGSTRPLPAGALRRRYPAGAADYLPAFRSAAEQMAGAGFLLAEDVEEAVAVAAAAFPE
jgi:hypothetical protein